MVGPHAHSPAIPPPVCSREHVSISQIPFLLSLTHSSGGSGPIQLWEDAKCFRLDAGHAAAAASLWGGDDSDVLLRRSKNTFWGSVFICLWGAEPCRLRPAQSDAKRRRESVTGGPQQGQQRLRDKNQQGSSWNMEGSTALRGASTPPSLFSSSLDFPTRAHSLEFNGER